VNHKCEMSEVADAHPLIAPDFVLPAEACQARLTEK
jgi:hypothetical protein